MNNSESGMDKLKTRINGSGLKGIIIRTINLVAIVYILFTPLILEKYQFSLLTVFSVYEWLDWYRLLFRGIKECTSRWVTLCKVFCWGSLVLLLLTVIVNCIRLFGSDSIVYDIIVYILVGIIAALIVTDIVLLLQSAKQEFKDDQDT